MNDSQATSADDQDIAEVSDLDRLLLTMEAQQVTRFHACPRITPQTIGMHHAETAIILTFLVGVEKITTELLLAALSHDQEELFTGDIPFTFKRDCPAARKAITSMEDAYRKSFLIQTHLESVRGHTLLKAADMLGGMMWCLHYEQGYQVFHTWEQAVRNLAATPDFGMTLFAHERERIRQLFARIMLGCGDTTLTMWVPSVVTSTFAQDAR